MNDEDLDELIPLVALHALPAGELDAAEAAISADPRLRAELDEMRASVALLSDATVVAPPAHLRRRVLDVVAATAQVEHPSAGQRPDLTIIEGDRHSDSLPLAAPRRQRPQWLGLSAAAAVCALVAGMVAWFALGGSPSESDQIADVIESSEAQTIPLDEGEMQGIRIVYSPSSGDAVLVGEGLPEPEANRAYQLWFIDGDAPVPSEVFRPDSDGVVQALIDDFTADDTEYAITEEPSGGSDAPTTDPIATSF